MVDNPRKTLIITLAAGGIVILVLYSLFQAKNLIVGPVLRITEPLDGQQVEYAVVDIKGTASNISEITLNDSPIYVDTKGAFFEKLIVPSGYSIIKMSVKDRFGRERTSLIRLMYLKEDEPIEMETSRATGTVATSTSATSSPITPTNNN